MPNPGQDVNILTSSVRTSFDGTDAGRSFMVVVADRGPTTKPRIVRSVSEYESVYGTRQSYGFGADAANAYFARGGQELGVVRVVGPAAVTATIPVTAAMTCNAASPGAWANGYKVVVSAGTLSGLKVQVQTAASVVVEQNDNLATNDAVRDAPWLNFVFLKNTATLITAGTYTLASGADDRASITGVHYTAALALITDEYGRGAVFIPGIDWTTTSGSTTVGAALNTFCLANYRLAIPDFAAATPEATAEAAYLAQATAYGSTGRASLRAFTPWPIVNDGAVRRTVPASAFVAGNRARAHATTGPNTAVAGEAGSLDTVADLELHYSATDGARLNASGVNCIRFVKGTPTIYGYRTMDTSDPRWAFGNVWDLLCSIVWDVRDIGERIVFKTIDGRGHLLASWQSETVGLLQSYVDKGQIFPAGRDRGYTADVGPSVNTLTTLANNEAHQRVSFRPSPTAEHVIWDISVANVNGPL